MTVEEAIKDVDLSGMEIEVCAKRKFNCSPFDEPILIGTYKDEIPHNLMRREVEPFFSCDRWKYFYLVGRKLFITIYY